jgi:hypothetical protein
MAAHKDMEQAMKRLAEVTTEIHAATVELRLTIHATRRNRRTPDEIRTILAGARSIVYQSRVIRRAVKARFRIH